MCELRQQRHQVGLLLLLLLLRLRLLVLSSLLLSWSIALCGWAAAEKHIEDVFGRQIGLA